MHRHVPEWHSFALHKPHLKPDKIIEDEATNYPTEFLNSLDVPGTPPHNLQLKVGSVIIMLPNLNHPRLCNGTRLSVMKLMNNVIQATIIKVLLYGAECWTVVQSDAAALGVFERKILRKIFGPICVGDAYRIRWNHELYELYGDVDVVSRVKIHRLRWLGHIARMEEDTPARKVFDAVIVGKRRRGRPRMRWQDQVMEALSTSGAANWRRRAQDRDAWRQIVQQAVTRQGL
ncbi:uncharacterized protein LOC122320474 [Drosophila ficusphila]|uniref:uncharacterized protein LOC122320474 n=1 Tax=Drosophila ficusphila TaxID=30025 RepID=UPI001C8AB425|nr:uncharacterized protein LOC122320474 [Drosophila ficusphila]